MHLENDLIVAGGKEELESIAVVLDDIMVMYPSI